MLSGSSVSIMHFYSHPTPTVNLHLLSFQSVFHIIYCFSLNPHDLALPSMNLFKTKSIGEKDKSAHLLSTYPPIRQILCSLLVLTRLQTFFISLTLLETIYLVGVFIHHRRRQWHPTPVLLPGKSHGRRSYLRFSNCLL